MTETTQNEMYDLPGRVDTGMLNVPGARLHYEVRGSGPILLILQGGWGDAGQSGGIIAHLTNHYTVVTYDRRGLSRSRLDDPANGANLQTHSEDAHRLLAELTTEPVLVFGNSFGALLGLDLAARHPEQIHDLVAHEPPSVQLLAEQERTRAMRLHEDVERTYHHDGAASAVITMVKMTAMDFEDSEPDAEPLAPGPHEAANLDFFFTHDFPAVRRYRPDLAALNAASTRIVPAAGRMSRQGTEYQCAATLAGELATALVEFPGGHGGSLHQPEAFATRLRDVLNDNAKDSA